MPPLLVKANPTTVFKFDLKPFAMIELSLSLGDPAVACCVTLDNRTPEDALEVHEWVFRGVASCKCWQGSVVGSGLFGSDLWRFMCCTKYSARFRTWLLSADYITTN